MLSEAPILFLEDPRIVSFDLNAVVVAPIAVYLVDEEQAKNLYPLRT